MKVRWDIDTLNTYLQTLKKEQQNLRTQHRQMIQQKNEVGISWKSPAGQDYQNRLSNDIEVLDNIIKQVDRQIDSLKKAIKNYQSCEKAVKQSLRRLP